MVETMVEMKAGLAALESDGSMAVQLVVELFVTMVVELAVWKAESSAETKVD